MSSNLGSMSEQWDRWLDRYSPPRNILGNEAAKQDEIDAQIRMLARYSPDIGVERWLTAITDRLDRAMQTRAWPSVREIQDACMAHRRDEHATTPPARNPAGGERSAIDSGKVAAAKMNSGQPVGDYWLWGRGAVQILRRGLVTRAQVDAYRQEHMLTLAQIWQPEEVAAWRAEAEARHLCAITLEDAEATRGKERRERAERVRAAATAIPDMRSPHADMERTDA